MTKPCFCLWLPQVNRGLEIFTLIGLVLHTGTIRTNYSVYNAFLNMSRDRFLIITRCLNFAENVPAGTPMVRLHRIKPNFSERKDSLLSPEGNFTGRIDGALKRAFSMSPVY